MDKSLVYWLYLINKQLETVQQEVQDALHARTHSISALLSDWRVVIIVSGETVRQDVQHALHETGPFHISPAFRFARGRHSKGDAIEFLFRMDKEWSY